MCGVDVVFFDEASTLRRLISGRLPRHVENAVSRSDVSLRVAMALQAPAHRKRLLLAHQRHILHWTVTGRAADAIGDVDAVIKENIIWQPVYPLPVERSSGFQALADRRQHRGIRPYLRMAGHTYMGGGKACECSLLDPGMAHSAMQPKVAGVVGVAKWNRLATGEPLVSCIRRLPDQIGQTCAISATLAMITPLLCPGQSEVLAQRIEQCRPRIAHQMPDLAVDR